MILVGDIGGTKTNLAYVDGGQTDFELQKVTSYPSQQHSSLRDIVEKFLAQNPAEISAATFGIAGPVVDGRCEATNLPWVVDAREMASTLKLASVGLINDLEATGYGVLQLREGDRLELNKGSARERGTIAIIAAGTGLGEGGMVWDGSRYRALPSEGGHTDFSPRNELEIDLLRFLLKRYQRVSFERVVSGPGLFNLYQFFRTRASYPEPVWLKEKIQKSDPSASISQAAIGGKDEVCVEALETFVSLYGAEAGNLALKLLATGGVFVGGGIAPKILPAMKTGSFMKSFTHKGRFSDLLHNVPVIVALNEKTALFGAAQHAVMTNDEH